MIGITDIKKAVDNKLLSISLNSKIYSDEVTQKLIRPCFFTRIYIERQEMWSANITDNFYTVIINYFSKEKTQLSNMEMLDKLRKSFIFPLEIHGRKILTSNITTEIESDFLTFKFSLVFQDDILTEDEIPQQPPAGELDFNLKNNK